MMRMSRDKMAETLHKSQQRIVQLNHAGASPSPNDVTDRVTQYLQLEKTLGGYAAQNQVENVEDDDKELSLPSVYASIASLIDAPKSANSIALVESATVGWTRAFYSMVQHQDLKRRKKKMVMTIGTDDTTTMNADNHHQPNVILISEVEYAANVVAACQWARDHHDDWTVLVLPSTRDPNDDSTTTGIVDLSVLDRMLEGTYCYKRKKRTTKQQSNCEHNNSAVENNDSNDENIEEEEEYEHVLLDPTKISIVAITHVPTNAGIVNPVEEIGDRIEKFNNRRRQQQQQPDENNGGVSVFYIVDACQSVGQIDLSVTKLKCHALVATGRKYLRGPRGTGFLYVSEDIVNDITPSHIDHYGVPVTKVPTYPQRDVEMLPVEDVLQFVPRNGAKRFEFWESNISSRLGLGAAVRYALKMGMPNIESEIETLSAYLRAELTRRIPTVRIHHRTTSKCGIVTFECPNMPSKHVKETMWANGFEISVVPATSTPIDSSNTNVPDLVRASVSYTNTREELDAFCSCLESIVEQYLK
jgi:selenocysteine lyase/cysteine desulfurase